jgi:enoyl-CoA hydratase/carnithine racemase
MIVNATETGTPRDREMHMSQKTVRLERRGAIATITLDRPEKLNALTEGMIAEVVDAIDEVRRDLKIRAVVLRGEGRAFCSGDDVGRGARFAHGNPDLQTRKRVAYPRLLLELLELRKPVIAMLRGHAVGAGMDVALACDFRVAAEDTQMGALFVRRGLGGGCSYLLPRFVGLGKATELLLLGEMIGAEEAIRLGLLTKVVPENRLEAATYELAERLASGPTASYGAIKNARNQGLGTDPVKGLEWQIVANVELLLHRDAYEGPRAFRERREPAFTGNWIDLPDSDGQPSGA